MREDLQFVGGALKGNVAIYSDLIGATDEIAGLVSGVETGQGSGSRLDFCQADDLSRSCEPVSGLNRPEYVQIVLGMDAARLFLRRQAIKSRQFARVEENRPFEADGKQGMGDDRSALSVHGARVEIAQRRAVGHDPARIDFMGNWIGGLTD